MAIGSDRSMHLGKCTQNVDRLAPISFLSDCPSRGVQSMGGDACFHGRTRRSLATGLVALTSSSTRSEGQRNLVEWIFGDIKVFRRIDTRHDRLPAAATSHPLRISLLADSCSSELQTSRLSSRPVHRRMHLSAAKAAVRDAIVLNSPCCLL